MNIAEIRWACCSSLEDLGVATSPTIKGKLDFRETNQEYMESFDVKAPFDQEKLDRAVGRSQCSRREMDRGIWENPLYYLTLKSYLKAKDRIRSAKVQKSA
jgi:hypothetical protein